MRMRKKLFDKAIKCELAACEEAPFTQRARLTYLPAWKHWTTHQRINFRGCYSGALRPGSNII